jgi:catechol 2,3-dioxygenase-like lactoylglutathione lyase family enzyme
MTTLSQVTPRLPVQDLERTIGFYCGRLGFRVEVSWPPETPTFVILRQDDTSLGFFETTEDHKGPIGYAELYIDVVGASELHEALVKRLAIEWGPEVYEYGRREFACRDPDGYLVIFTEPVDEPSQPRDTP